MFLGGKIKRGVVLVTDGATDGVVVIFPGVREGAHEGGAAIIPGLDVELYRKAGARLVCRSRSRFDALMPHPLPGTREGAHEGGAGGAMLVCRSRFDALTPHPLKTSTSRRRYASGSGSLATKPCSLGGVVVLLTTCWSRVENSRMNG